MSVPYLHRFQGWNSVHRPSISEAEAWWSYNCGHCRYSVSGVVVATVAHEDHSETRWLLCTTCGEGSVLTGMGQFYPGDIRGPEIDGLPVEVDTVYDEARRCLAASAYTACEMVCRKILMHVAVDKGAPEGKNFTVYLSHLETQGYITPPMKQWTDLIRRHGNVATHEIKLPDRVRAESTLMFTSELLRLVYEMEWMAANYT